MTYGHGSDNSGDRAMGLFWEDRFVDWCNKAGHAAFHIPQRGGAPDVLVDDRHAHEVKHKAPRRPWFGPKNSFPMECFGLEDYRIDLFEAFERRTGQRVFYTTHDWSLTGTRESRIDLLESWRTAPLDDLLRDRSCWLRYDFRTYKNGRLTDERQPGRMFHWLALNPLKEYLGIE